MSIEEILKETANIAKTMINRRFSSWDIKIDTQQGCYILTSPNGSAFRTDNLDSPIKSIELKKAEDLYMLIVQYQIGSGDAELVHLRNGKAG